MESTILTNYQETEPIMVRFPSLKINDNYYTHSGVPISKDHYSRIVYSKEQLHPDEQIDLYNQLKDLLAKAEEIKALLKCDMSHLKDDDKMMDIITDYIASCRKIDIDDLFSKSRKREVCECRFLCMFVIKMKLPRLSHKRIGRYFGGRDHTTSISSVQTIKDLMDTDENLKREAFELLSVDYWNIEPKEEPPVFTIGGKQVQLAAI